MAMSLMLNVPIKLNMFMAINNGRQTSFEGLGKHHDAAGCSNPFATCGMHVPNTQIPHTPDAPPTDCLDRVIV